MFLFSPPIRDFVLMNTFRWLKTAFLSEQIN